MFVWIMPAMYSCNQNYSGRAACMSMVNSACFMHTHAEGPHQPQSHSYECLRRCWTAARVGCQHQCAQGRASLIPWHSAVHHVRHMPSSANCPCLQTTGLLR